MFGYIPHSILGPLEMKALLKVHNARLTVTHCDLWQTVYGAIGDLSGSR